MDPAEVAKEEIQETVFSREEIQEIPVDLQTEFFKTGDFQARTDRLGPPECPKPAVSKSERAQ